MVGGVHSLAPATWLSGTSRTKASAGASMSATLNQVVAQQIGQSTTLPSLEVPSETTQQAAACSGSACFYNTTLSFRDAHSPLPMEFNPRKVFAQLFGEGDTPEERAAIPSQTTSLLDRIGDRTSALQRDLGARRSRRARQLPRDAARDRAARAARVEPRPVGDQGAQAPIGELDSFGAQVDLMFDLIALAYQADLTRVASYIMVAEGTNRTYNHIGVSDAFHPVSHHANDVTRIEKLVKIQTWHMDRFAAFVRSWPRSRRRWHAARSRDVPLRLEHVEQRQAQRTPLPTMLVGGGNGKLGAASTSTANDAARQRAPDDLDKINARQEHSATAQDSSRTCRPEGHVALTDSRVALTDSLIAPTTSRCGDAQPRRAERQPHRAERQPEPRPMPAALRRAAAGSRSSQGSSRAGRAGQAGLAAYPAPPPYLPRDRCSRS